MMEKTLNSVPPVVAEVKALWEAWNIRACILVSLFFQVSLTFLAPWRKSRGGNLAFIIWMFYLSAESVSLYTIGLISHSAGGDSTDEETIDLLVFWAPFLLIHLGGPDTITALAVEDNTLWLRHLLQLATQAFGTLYLFYGISQRDKLIIPTVFMFLNGSAKYLERTASLYIASEDRFRESIRRKPDPGPDYATLMDEYASRKTANIPVYIRSKFETEDEEDHCLTDDQDLEANNIRSDLNQFDNRNCNTSNVDDSTGGHDHDVERQQSSNYDATEEMELVRKAHEFYMSFRGLVSDVVFSFKERRESRRYFLGKNNGMDGKIAFKVIQIELNFIYGFFFTKASVVQNAYSLIRVFSFAAVTVSLLLFCFQAKVNYYDVDVYITYVLLGGALIMDVIAVIMFCFSDWAVAAAVNSPNYNRQSISTTLRCWWLRHRPRRWSEKISQYNLLYHCLHHHPAMFKILHDNIKTVFPDALYAPQSDFEDELGNLIFEQLHVKAMAKRIQLQKTTEEAVCRGDLCFDVKYAQLAKRFLAWTTTVDYDESVFVWHIATDLCINSTSSSSSSSPSSLTSAEPYRRYSKHLSDYLMYLFILQPEMISDIAGIAQDRFQDTCAEAKKFIHRKMPPRRIGKMKKLNRFFVHAFRFIGKVLCGVENIIFYCFCCCFWKCCGKKSEEQDRLEQLCGKIIEVNTELAPVEVKGDRSKSVLFDACRLAKELKKVGDEFGENVQWEVTFKVWVELLCYAASRTNTTAHVKQLRIGGELITLVWLLADHLGLGDKFSRSKTTAWARLVVQK